MKRVRIILIALIMGIVFCGSVHTYASAVKDIKFGKTYHQRLRRYETQYFRFKVTSPYYLTTIKVSGPKSCYTTLTRKGDLNPIYGWAPGYSGSNGVLLRYLSPGTYIIEHHSEGGIGKYSLKLSKTTRYNALSLKGNTLKCYKVDYSTLHGEDLADDGIIYSSGKLLTFKLDKNCKFYDERHRKNISKKEFCKNYLINKTLYYQGKKFYSGWDLELVIKKKKVTKVKIRFSP